jgi:hypothetical protein
VYVVLEKSDDYSEYSTEMFLNREYEYAWTEKNGRMVAVA